MNASTPIRPPKAPVPSRVPPKELLSPLNFLIAAIALAAAVFAVYSPALNFQFILDDHRFLSDPRILNSGHIWEYFSNYVWAQFTGGPPSFYRPIFVLWLRISYIFAGMSSWGWHFLSIGKHLAVAFLLGLLVWKLLRDRTAALLAATLFALHPAQTESVSWVTVPDPLMCIMIFGSVLLYLKYADYLATEPKVLTGKAGRRARKTARAGKNESSSSWWLVGSAVLCFAAMLTKETAIMVPVIFFVLALRMPHRAASEKHKEEEVNLGARLLAALRQTAMFWGAAAIYFLLRLNALGAKLGAETQHLPWGTVLLSWPATLWFYIKVLLWPVHSHSFADPDLANSFSVRGVLLPAFALLVTLALLAGLFYWAWKKAGRNFSPREASAIQISLLLGALFLIVPILPALDLNALNPGDFLHGRYTYLPLIGLMLLLATAWHLAGKARIPLLTAAAAVAIAFAMLTLSQDSQWKDDATVFTVAHELAPHNEPVARNLANTHVQAALQLDQEGRCDEAIPVFKQVTEEYPNDWFAWAGLGDCQVQLNDLAGAEQSLHRAADISQSSRVREQWQAVRERLQNLQSIK